MGQAYSETCRRNKGQRIGPASNYFLIGLVNGLLASEKMAPQEQDALKTWLLDTIGNADRSNIDLAKAPNIFPFVPYCMIKFVEKKNRDPIAYLTIAFGDAASAIKPLIIRTLLTIGTLNPSPPPPTPAMQELKTALIKMGVFSDPSL